MSLEPQHDPLKNLDACLIPFENLVINTDRIPRTKLGEALF